MTSEPVSIADTVAFGVAFDPKNSDRVARMDLNELYASVGRLFDLLAEREIDYALAGGVAMRAYSEGRNTQDVDLVMASIDLAKLPELRIEEKNELFAQSWFGDLRVDVLLADNEPFRAVRQRFATLRSFAGREVPTATPEGLLLMKLFALPSLYRQGQFAKVRVYEGDVADLLDATADVAPPVWESLEGVLLKSDIDELRRIVADLVAMRAERSKRFGGAAS